MVLTAPTALLGVEKRHRLGTHYTPRAYVERPALVEPLREDWENAKAAALRKAADVDMAGGRD